MSNLITPCDIQPSPGPWTFRGSLGPKSNPQLKGPYVIEDYFGGQVAIMSGWRDEITKENAKLICAAPTMRAAIEGSIETIRQALNEGIMPTPKADRLLRTLSRHLTNLLESSLAPRGQEGT